MKDFQDTISLKIGSEELIKNIELRNLIKYKLNKDDFTAEELESVDEIILDSKNIVGDYNTVYFEELDLFPNLERISIRNLGISNQNITKLKNIKQIEFINCELEELEGLQNVQCLKLINSEVDNIETIGKLTEITELHLINMKFENFDMLKIYKNLNKLVIKNIKDFLLSKIDFYLPINYLSIENIDCINLNVLSKYKELSTFSVDRNEAEKFENELKKLKDNGIQILLNDQYEY